MVGEEAIVAIFITHVQRNEHGGSEAQRETEEIDCRVGTAAKQIPERRGEIISQHGSYISAAVTNRPSSMCITRSARLACSSACVTMTMVVPNLVTPLSKSITA